MLIECHLMKNQVVEMCPLPKRKSKHAGLPLQIFRQFIEERIAAILEQKSLSDEFEKEVIRYQEKASSSNPGARIIKSQYEQVKKEGGALVKAVKSKVRSLFYAPHMSAVSFCHCDTVTQSTLYSYQQLFSTNNHVSEL